MIHWKNELHDILLKFYKQESQYSYFNCNLVWLCIIRYNCFFVFSLFHMLFIFIAPDILYSSTQCPWEICNVQTWFMDCYLEQFLWNSIFPGIFYRNPLMICQHWLRWWLVASGQQVITLDNIDPYQCCHSITRHSELKLYLLHNYVKPHIVSLMLIRIHTP